MGRHCQFFNTLRYQNCVLSRYVHCKSTCTTDYYLKKISQSRCVENSIDESAAVSRNNVKMSHPVVSRVSIL